MVCYMQMHTPRIDVIDEQIAPNFSRCLVGRVVLGFLIRGRQDKTFDVYPLSSYVFVSKQKRNAFRISSAG